ncbi:MAG: cyclic nucleotide-binding domain-containing protein [Oscillochloridaceae bacterium umkhey_bin13]
MLSPVERLIVLKSAPLFRAVSDRLLAEVAELLSEEEYLAGSEVFRHGEPGSSMFLIVEGEVRIHVGDHTLNTLGSRAVFGEMAVLDPAPRAANATALSDLLLLRLEADLLNDLLERRPELGYGLMYVLLDQIRARVTEIEALAGSLLPQGAERSQINAQIAGHGAQDLA